MYPPVELCVVAEQIRGHLTDIEGCHSEIDSVGLHWQQHLNNSKKNINSTRLLFQQQLPDSRPITGYCCPWHFEDHRFFIFIILIRGVIDIILLKCCIKLKFVLGSGNQQQVLALAFTAVLWFMYQFCVYEPQVQFVRPSISYAEKERCCCCQIKHSQQTTYHTVWLSKGSSGKLLGDIIRSV